MCVHLCNCKLYGWILWVSVSFKTSWKMFTQRGEVCSPDVLNENEVRVGSLDLAFGGTRNKGITSEWNFPPQERRV